jgi:hypothetical protein
MNPEDTSDLEKFPVNSSELQLDSNIPVYPLDESILKE